MRTGIKIALRKGLENAINDVLTSPKEQKAIVEKYSEMLTETLYSEMLGVSARDRAIQTATRYSSKDDIIQNANDVLAFLEGREVGGDKNI